VLNTPVFKEMIVGTPDGKEPTGKTMHLTGLEAGKPTGYQMKASSPVPQRYSCAQNHLAMNH
jgi:hypothetical protein